METAKVDIRKLQLLNDRINQCLDALNQVRVSVHGLSHTGQFGGQGAGFPTGGGGFGYPQAGIGFPQQIPPFGQIGAGLGHTSGIGSFQPFAQPFPLAQQPFGPGIQQQPPQPPWAGQGPWLGLSHTSPEFASQADPFVAVRLAQTFPYAQYPVPPVVSLY
jgi:hypothetical protein